MPYSHDFLTSKICLLTLFAEIKFSQKIPNLKYILIYISKLRNASLLSDNFATK